LPVARCWRGTWIKRNGGRVDCGLVDPGKRHFAEMVGEL